MQGHLLGLLRGAALVHHVGHGEEVCLVGLEAQLGDAVAAGQQGDLVGGLGIAATAVSVG